MLDRLGPVVRAIAQDERSQLRNRELATERILEQLRKAARPRRTRRPTKPTAASRERRLERSAGRPSEAAAAARRRRLELTLARRVGGRRVDAVADGEDERHDRERQTMHDDESECGSLASSLPGTCTH